MQVTLKFKKNRRSLRKCNFVEIGEVWFANWNKITRGKVCGVVCIMRSTREVRPA